MKLLDRLSETKACRGGYVSIGNFDGVHLGHRSMISTLINRARAARVPSVVFTFEPHPIAVMRPESKPGLLTTLDRKVQLLADCGIDFVIAYPTDWDLLRLTPDQFFRSILVDELQARGLVEGENFYYGANREGNIATLRTECQAAGLSLDVVPPLTVSGQMVSSSVIRKLIQQGCVSQANELLGSRYQIRGKVARGSARGRQIGFPTANLSEIRTELPCDGVYAGVAYVNGQDYPAAINLGANPTFQENQRKVEVHLANFQGDLYGQELNVDFIARLRDTKAFPGVEELKKQLRVDVAMVARLVTLGSLTSDPSHNHSE